MKKLIILILVSISMYACYDDYTTNSMDFNTVFFTKGLLNRSIIAGEGMQLKVGVNLGGLRVNEEDRTVEVSIDNSLLNAYPEYTLLPAEYYTMTTEGSTNSEIIIPKGEFMGFASVKFDSLKVANDLNFKDFNYALPLRITSSSVDSIHGTNGVVVIPVKLMNTYEGNYYSIGTDYVKDIVTGEWKVFNVHGKMDDYTIAPKREFSSIMSDTIVVDGVSLYGGDKYAMKLVINGNDVEILPIAGSLLEVTQDSTSTWDADKRWFSLAYTYTDDNIEHKVRETYVFRNRIRDGVSEWRWKGFEGN